jgi:glycosyltransferase involved in cell wall biosynthesis
MSASPAGDVLFSIVVPSYNRAHLIDRTLASLLAQTEPSFEIIVVDDGGGDNTESVVQQFSDRRVSYHRKAHGERGAARNYGSARSRGPYLNYFDSDDLAHPNHLAEARAMIARHGRPPAFHMPFDRRTADNQIIERSRRLADGATGRIRPDTLLRGNHLSTNGVFLRRDVALAHPFQEHGHLAEDWVLWLRIAARFPLFESNTTTSTIVHHESRSVAVTTIEQLEERARLTRECLERDDAFMQRFGARGLNMVEAHLHTYAALHAAMLGCGPAAALRNLSVAARRHPQELFRRRTLAVLKHLWLRRGAGTESRLTRAPGRSAHSTTRRRG